MNSWKEMNNNHEIYLNLRSNFYFLYSKTSCETIQKELRKIFGKLIKLYIVENNNFLKKTPMEYLKLLYTEQKLKLSKNLLNDPNFIMIQSLFDVKFNETSVKII